ncbi:hypothetical protein DFH09DRAFT_1076452 [Mycena vulgaris]|nr:hypothetical protein DFH09DRAFT_1076452 [Mycena vulgaris]
MYRGIEYPVALAAVAVVLEVCRTMASARSGKGREQCTLRPLPSALRHSIPDPDPDLDPAPRRGVERCSKLEEAGERLSHEFPYLRFNDKPHPADIEEIPDSAGNNLVLCFITDLKESKKDSRIFLWVWGAVVTSGDGMPENAPKTETPDEGRASAHG